MLVVPVESVATQQVTVLLGGQNCQLSIYQTAFGLFMNVYVNNGLIIGGVICQNLNRIVRNLYLGFLGDFVWYDNQGTDDPTYTGIGDRFSLIYVEASELPSGVG